AADRHHVEVRSLRKGGAGNVRPTEHRDRLVVRERQETGEAIGGGVVVDELPGLPPPVRPIRRRADPPAQPTQPPRRRGGAAAGDDQPGGIVGEAGEAVGRLRDERAVVVVRPSGEVTQTLERLHASDSTLAFSVAVAGSRSSGYRSARGSFGNPSTRSPTMLRMTSSVPPATRMPGTPSTSSDQAYVPHSPLSAVMRRPSMVASLVASRWKFWVIGSVAIDISGPGSCPARIFAMARWFVYRATCNFTYESASRCRTSGSSASPR